MVRAPVYILIPVDIFISASTVPKVVKFSTMASNVTPD